MGPRLIVAVCLERCTELIVALIAIRKAGAAFLPLPTNQPVARIANIMADSDGRWILLTRSVDYGYGYVIPVNTRQIQISWSDKSSWPDHNPNTSVRSSQLAYVLPTSGTTAKPRAVAVDHAAITNRCFIYPEVWELNQSSRVLFQSDFWHDSAMREWLLPLTCGASVLVASCQDQQDPDRLLALCRSRGCTQLAATPSRLETLIGNTPPGPVTVTAGGESLSPSLPERLFAADPSRLMHSFGSTVTCLACAFHDLSRVGGMAPKTHSGPRIPIGRPLPNTSMHVLDEDGNPCPIGIPGEIHIGITGLASGYLDNPELTAAKFIADPTTRLYKSGDLAAWNAYLQMLRHSKQPRNLLGFLQERQSNPAAYLKRF